MAREKQSVVCLDTHIVVWLYAGLVEKLTDPAKKAIDQYDPVISHFVRLELQYLFEIGRIKIKPGTIIRSLSQAINLKVSDHPLEQIVDEALRIDWTRDVFDRLLVAEALSRGCSLISADKQIRSSFKQTVW
jgi:PIN domain nuclease of toxin-antitoxin system